MHVLGDYYSDIKNYDKMKMYFIMASNEDDGEYFSMTLLGKYYKYIEKNYQEMKKFFSMAINHTYYSLDESGINYEFGEYYENIEKNYELMERYYLIEINNGIIDKFKLKSLINLGNYYKYINDYDKMKIYYLMAIDMGDHDIMYKLGDYYENIEKDYDLMEKYYSMAFNK